MKKYRIEKVIYSVIMLLVLSLAAMTIAKLIEMYDLLDKKSTYAIFLFGMDVMLYVILSIHIIIYIIVELRRGDA